jgi:hypothetical protein
VGGTAVGATDDATELLGATLDATLDAGALEATGALVGGTAVGAAVGAGTFTTTVCGTTTVSLTTTGVGDAQPTAMNTSRKTTTAVVTEFLFISLPPNVAFAQSKPDSLNQLRFCTIGVLDVVSEPRMATYLMQRLGAEIACL